MTWNNKTMMSALGAFALCSVALGYAYSYGPLVTVAYQGRLEQDGAPVTGPRNLTFFVVRTESAAASTALWTEAHTAVPVNAGLFQVELGSVTGFPEGMFASNQLFLGVLVDGVELQSRHRFTQVPYAVETSGMPPGTMVQFGGATAPPGWLLCDGRSVSATTYPRLFDVIGGQYGGGSPLFNLPDLRGRFPLGNDIMGGTAAGRSRANEAKVLGGAAGEETTADLINHTHLMDSAGAHTHPLRAACGGACNNASDGLARGNGSVDTTSFTAVSAGAHTHTVQVAGTTDRANNMPPYVTVNYIIKY